MSEESPHQKPPKRAVVTLTAAGRPNRVLGRQGTGSTILQARIRGSDVAKPGSPVPPLYARLQSMVQQMLHSEHGVPVRSHKRRLITATPSAFTGSDIVQWLMKHLSIESREAIHVANLLSSHGFFFCVESLNTPVRDDGTLFRFQTFYYWPSCTPSTSDYDYSVYLVKQVLRSKHRIRLLDYELTNLHKLKLRLAREWRPITEKAHEDVRVFREQKRIAKVIIGSQEEAFWRLHRPPPGENSVGDSLLSRYYTELTPWQPQEPDVLSLKQEVEFLKESASRPRVHMSTALNGMLSFCQKYAEFDPILAVPQPSNPWVSGEDTLWIMEKSYLEYPIEHQVRRWACSFLDLLFDVNGRYRFEQFCKSQFCLENVRFWQACRDLKSIPHSVVADSVKLIYAEFLQRRSASEVNISAKVQEEIEKDLKAPSRYAFQAAQNQVFELMQNDIYPRFLKTSEYKDLIAHSRDSASGGRGFFAKFKVYSTYAGGRRLKPQAVPEEFISPCLPERFKKRNVSITRKLTSMASSASLDDLFLATGGGMPKQSSYTDDIIDALIAPTSENRHRRVSAPNAPPYASRLKNTRGFSIDEVFEEDKVPLGQTPPEPGMGQSYSADDMAQLAEERSKSSPSKWRDSGLTDLTKQESQLSSNGDVLSSSQSVSSKLSDQKEDLLQVPGFPLSKSPAIPSVFSTSPKGPSFEYESISDRDKKMYSSTESVHSASSLT